MPIDSEQAKRNSILPTIMLGVFFFVFGFVTWLNGTLIPYLKISCELNAFQSQLVAFAFYISYFVTALPSSWILKKTGFKNGMMLGLIVMAIGAFLFIPAASGRSYSTFLFGLFVIGTGLSILQTAVNPYVTIVGPIESAARRISIMGICNKVAGVLAPIIMGTIILKDVDLLTEKLKLLDAVSKAAELDLLANRVVVPYSVLGGGLLLLALLLRFSPLPEIEEEKKEAAPTKDRPSIFSYPYLWLGVIALFLYVGVEVVAGDTISLYGQSLKIPMSQAKYFPSFTLASMVVGYILGIFLIPNVLSQSRALAISAITGLLFSVMVLITDGYLSVLFIALLGLANALVWPAIWPLAIEGLGRYTKTASALLIMSIAGGALLPLVWGSLSDIPSIGPKHAYVILLPSYLFILFYAVKGHRMGKKTD